MTDIALLGWTNQASGLSPLKEDWAVRVTGILVSKPNGSTKTISPSAIIPGAVSYTH